MGHQTAAARGRHVHPATRSGSRHSPKEGQLKGAAEVLPTERLSNDQRRFVDHLLAQSEDLRAARDLATDFGGVIRARDSAGLATWLQKAAISTHAEFRAFAASLRRDIAAVEAAVREPWSNGQTEGQVNKLKLVKRQTYGRAKLDLLERRLLAA